MLFETGHTPVPGARDAIRSAYREAEPDVLLPLLEAAQLPDKTLRRVLVRARRLAQRSRELLQRHRGVEAVMQEYDLSSEEGVLLMCLAEALLRIPDAETQEQLIRDKLARGHWDEHLGRSDSLLVNASTWGLMLTGRLVALASGNSHDPRAVLQRLVARAGEKVVRVALAESMDILARYFVMGTTIGQALQRTRDAGGNHRYSYDCLGEAACDAQDVARYFTAYRDAIDEIGAQAAEDAGGFAGPGLSVKLSALHPRYEYGQRGRVLGELIPRVRALVSAARTAGIGITIDAEEADRLELSLDVFEAVYTDQALNGWEHFGLAIQAYQKNAMPALRWLAGLAGAANRRIPLRLVKGAYWDSEIKRAQVGGLDGYPVFTRKSATDVCYLACARYLLEQGDVFYPQFATHNAHTVSYVLELAGAGIGYEFQRLHGMGEPLYQALAEEQDQVPCRVYAPVGSHEELLPYLVRRLLENGANTSFINQLADESLPIEKVITDPLTRLRAVKATPHPRIALPAALYGDQRRNARGLDLSDPLALMTLDRALQAALAQDWSAAPLVGGEAISTPARPVTDPADRRRTVGVVQEADAAVLARALELASRAAPGWDATPAGERAAALERGAALLEQHLAELMALSIREGGRCVADALAEVREAVDYCRYYAQQARQAFSAPVRLAGPTGEDNALRLHGRGVFACISPWNFPVAIFAGQVAAALAAGNAVIAKPARLTPLTAQLAIGLLHQAGIPDEVLHYLPGSGAALGTALLADPRLAGVAFTGSTETAWTLQQGLAGRRGPIVPLIAETGGQNVMIVDSSALPQQVVHDVLGSAFNSAGQRCSALRVLFVQTDIADRVIDLLAGAMDELRIGDPALLSTDVGPVIDEQAQRTLAGHVARMSAEARLIKALPLPPATEHGSYFAPHMFEIDRLDRLEREVFGPILHVIRFEASALDRVIDAVNRSGYGLTLGVHSRIESTWERVRRRARVGNLYINRNMIGAVVGVQPFGGEGLSGTGPKAGGPHYLQRFATERTVTINTAAVGGNAGLLSMDEE